MGAGGGRRGGRGGAGAPGREAAGGAVAAVLEAGRVLGGPAAPRGGLSKDALVKALRLLAEALGEATGEGAPRALQAAAEVAARGLAQKNLMNHRDQVRAPHPTPPHPTHQSPLSAQEPVGEADSQPPSPPLPRRRPP